MSNPIDVPSSDRIDATNPIGTGGKKLDTTTQSFQSYMEQPGAAGAKAVGSPSVSPFDLAHGQTTLTATPSYDTLLTQTKTAQTTLGGIRTQLSTPNLKIKQAHKYVLKNKLPEANSLLRSVNNKLGAELPEEQGPTGSGPINKFLGMVAEGQAQLESAKKQLNNLKLQKGHINPADMLLIQVKMNKAQQLLEFSSVVLSKAVEDFKMLMQIQL